MASTISRYKCKQCGGVVINELDCRTLEEWSRCQRCGCGFDYELKRNKKGKVVFNGKKQAKYRLRKWEGHGVIHLSFQQGGGVHYHLNKPLSKKNRKRFFLDIENNPEINKKESSLIIWDKKKKQAVPLYGKIPEDFVEM